RTLDRLLFSESLSRVVLTVPRARLAEAEKLLAGVPHAAIGEIVAEPRLRIDGIGAGLEVGLAELKAAWQGTLKVLDS
ncbi:MAG: hypothetical protein H0X45_07915, partial [Planctomycetes bacterium]|nr:hypothetical protein [Planctomycetota bacterium]